MDFSFEKLVLKRNSIRTEPTRFKIFNFKICIPGVNLKVYSPSLPPSKLVKRDYVLKSILSSVVLIRENDQILYWGRKCSGAFFKNASNFTVAILLASTIGFPFLLQQCFQYFFHGPNFEERAQTRTTK